MWTFMYECGFYWVAVLSLTIYGLFQLFHWLLAETFVAIPASGKHSWKNVAWLDKPCYCSMCESLMLSGIGLFCDCCGACTCVLCINRADRKLPCKQVAVDEAHNNRFLQHHWVKGNLPLNPVCCVCHHECWDSDKGIHDIQCSWCQRVVHKNCKSNFDSNCDFGEWRQLIVPPWAVRTTSRRTVPIRRQQRHVTHVIHPGWPDWTPLIIIGNRKSGNSDCDQILCYFRRLLNPCQIIDISEKSPAVALKWITFLNKAKNEFDKKEDTTNWSCRIMVAGGDGTIAWILNTIHDMDLKPSPAVGIIPLGTGNDLSRVLGWGSEVHAKIDSVHVLRNVLSASPVQLDRWKVLIEPYRHLGLRLPKSKSMFMYNYLSIGVDAQVTLDFHRTRESRFYLFSSRIFNKFLYLIFGTHQALAANCQNLQDRLEIFLDGKRVDDIPSIESIVVLNIPSWGAGVSLWSMGNGDVASQSINDGYLEVVAIYSSMHIAQLQVGMSQPVRLGQAKVVEIRLKSASPIQVDGEPWKQTPASVVIKHNDCATMLQLSD